MKRNQSEPSQALTVQQIEDKIRVLVNERAEHSRKAQQCSSQIADLLEQKQQLSGNQISGTIYDDLRRRK